MAVLMLVYGEEDRLSKVHRFIEGGHSQAHDVGDGQADLDGLAFDVGYGRAQGVDGKVIGWNSAKESEVQEMVVRDIVQSDGADGGPRSWV